MLPLRDAGDAFEPLRGLPLRVVGGDRVPGAESSGTSGGTSDAESVSDASFGDGSDSSGPTPLINAGATGPLGAITRGQRGEDY